MNATAPPTEPPPPTPPIDHDLPPAAHTPTIVGGVCALLADRLGLDALWIRIGFVLLALADGLGFVVYGALWLALVAGPMRRSPALTLLGGAVLVIGIPLILNDGFIDGPLAIIAILAGFAIALWQRPEQRQRATWDRPPAPARPAATWLSDDGPPPGDASPSSSRWSRPPRPEPSPLGSITLGLAIAVAALGALVDEANGGRLHPEQWLGAAAVVCGVGLLVGTVRGHARWLIVPALALAATGIGAGHMARLGIGASDLAGDRWVYVYTDTSGTFTERVGVGNIHVQIDEAPSRPVTIDARTGIGTISVTTNDQVAVDVTHNSEVTRIGELDGPADVIVMARVGFGSVDLGWWSMDTRHPGDTVVPEDGPPIPSRPDGLGRLSFVHDAVSVTEDGWFVLGDGEAVVDDQNRVVVGENYDESNDVTVIYTGWGEFRLLPRGLLITPDQVVLDLEAIRGDRAEDAPATDTTAGVQP